MAKKTKNQKRKATKKEKDRIKQSVKRGKKLKSESPTNPKPKPKEEPLFSIGPNATEEEIELAVGKVMRRVSRQKDVVDAAQVEFVRLNNIFNALDQRLRQFDGK